MEEPGEEPLDDELELERAEGDVAPPASFLRCASSDALNAAAESKLSSPSAPCLSTAAPSTTLAQGPLDAARPRGVADRLDELVPSHEPRSRASETAFSSCS